MPFRLVPAPWYKNRFARFRVSIQTFLQEQIAASVDTPDDALAAELWKAILLGRRTDLPDDLLHRFRHAGIMHLLVVSGLHVGLVAALSVAMMRWLLRFPPLAARTVSILPVVGYVMIAGGSPPALRAGMMYILWAAAGLFRRHSTVSVTAFWTAASFAVFWPRHGSRVGLQISFTIVAALMFWGPLLFEQMPRLLMPDPFKPRSLWSSRDVTAAQFSRWLRLSLSASLAALFGLIPWARAVFGLVTPASIIVNAIAIPWTSMILFTGALAHGIHALFGITTGFRWLFLMISGLARIADWGSGLPGGSWVVSVAGWDPWTLLVIILMVVACLFLVWFRRWTMFWFGAALLGGALMVSYAPATRCPDVVLFHTAGTGPCAFFRTGRDILMVDGGGSYFGRNVLRGFRRAWPCSPRVRFVLTRNRMDHAGGFLSLAGQYDGSLGLWVLDATGRSQAARRMMAEIPHAEEALGEEAPEWIAPFRVRTEDAGGLLVEFGDTVWWLTERLPARLPESAAGHWVVRIVPYRASLGALQRIPYAPSGAICVIQSNRFGGGADENAIRWAFQERGWKVLSTGTCGAVIQRSQGTIESWKGYSGE
jgi:ComEC/Rec2-related protein